MSLPLATKGLLYTNRIIPGGGHISVEEAAKPKIKVNSIKYTNGKDDKTQTITIKEIIDLDIINENEIKLEQI